MSPWSALPKGASPLCCDFKFSDRSDARLAETPNRPALSSTSTRQSFRAFALADPYRVVVDIPQVNFALPAGTGSAGRGLIKAFRYGLVMPGGSRIVFDLTGPAEVFKSYVLDAANGQPPKLVLKDFKKSTAPRSCSHSPPPIGPN